MTQKDHNNIASLIDNSGCFDLQFRKDTRHERTNSPTYYRWKTQLIVTMPKEKVGLLKKMQHLLDCGKVHISKGQARFSVQKIDDVVSYIIPFLKKNKLSEKKKKDFELWQRAVNIIYANKGKQLLAWKKNDLLSLVAIHQSAIKYKNKPRSPKWIEMAKLMTKTS